MYVLCIYFLENILFKTAPKIIHYHLFDLIQKDQCVCQNFKIDSSMQFIDIQTCTVYNVPTYIQHKNNKYFIFQLVNKILYINIWWKFHVSNIKQN